MRIDGRKVLNTRAAITYNQQGLLEEGTHADTSTPPIHIRKSIHLS